MSEEIEFRANLYSWFGICFCFILFARLHHSVERIQGHLSTASEDLTPSTLRAGWYSSRVDQPEVDQDIATFKHFLAEKSEEPSLVFWQTEKVR